MIPSDISAPLIEQGVLGFVVLLLLYALWSERKGRLDAEADAREQRDTRATEIRAMMSERLDDQKQHADQIMENTRTLEKALLMFEAKRNV